MASLGGLSTVISVSAEAILRLGGVSHVPLPDLHDLLGIAASRRTPPVSPTFPPPHESIDHVFRSYERLSDKPNAAHRDELLIIRETDAHISRVGLCNYLSKGVISERDAGKALKNNRLVISMDLLLPCLRRIVFR